MVWPVVLIGVILLVVYLIIMEMVAESNIAKLPALSQFLIILVASAIYIFSVVLYFLLKYPTLF